MKLAILLLITATAFSQTGKVVQLTPQDAERAKMIYDQKVALDKLYADFQEEIAKKYLAKKEGWYGFEFSEDFKFIVPKVSPPTPSPLNGCFTTPYFTGPITAPDSTQQ